MATTPSKKRKPISYVPTDASELYPSEDGKPMAVSDYHRKLLIWVLQALEAHFAENRRRSCTTPRRTRTLTSTP